MFESYNNLATYSLGLTQKTIFTFGIVCGILSFLVFFILFSIDNSDDNDGGIGYFLLSFSCSVISAGVGFIFGFLLSKTFTAILFYILPVLLICFCIYKIKPIIEFIRRHKSKVKVK